jgi:nitrite reductase (NADH) large subunit
MARARLLIVGNGMTGLRFLEELLERAPDQFAITVVGAEPQVAYNRVLLSSLLAAEIGAGELTLRPRDWYAAHGVELLTGTRVRSLDVTRRNVILCNGARRPFDKLLLATGSEPVRLAIPGADLPGVASFRSLADVAQLERAIAAARPAVVIGGGLLGIEAACGLARRGLAVTLVHLADRLMERQLDEEGGALLAAALAATGVRVLLRAQTRAIRGASRVEAVELADGKLLPCALAVLAVGIRPSVAFANEPRLQLGRGFIVDAGMRTSVADVFAVGECAEHRGICCGLLEPCYQQAKVAAGVLAGEPRQFVSAAPACSLKVSGIGVFSVGDCLGHGADSILLRDASTASYRKLVMREGRLAGAVLVGDTSDASWYADLIRSGRPVAALRDALAFGQAFAEAA